MPAIVVAVIVFVAFFLAYRFYSRYLAESVYALDKDFKVPSHEFEDGVDYVPTNKHILFGHHFTSVAGAAPIVGPALAVFWGWLPAMVWIVLGTIFAAGAHDFGAIVVSGRNRAQNIGTLAQSVITPRSRTLFLVIIFFLLTLVNAVFGIVIAILLQAYPGAVLPVVAVIPIAMTIGQLVYRRRGSVLLPTILGLLLLYACIPLGQALPITVDPLASAVGLAPQTVWIVIIFAYTWFAARLPVWLLLQPRDYINSYQLFVALAVVFLGMLVGFNTIVAPAVADVPASAPPWFPILFITIACGAISGFHSLVSSGTTSKQIDNETDARYVGYMGSLGEGTLAMAAVLATTAVGTTALWHDNYSSFAVADDGALTYFVEGVGSFVSNLGIPASVGVIFAAVLVVTFAGTTMDTSVRLQRYVIQEIGEITRVRLLARNLTLAATIAVLISAGLALFPFGGTEGGGSFAFGRLWQLFGTTNQLTAGLALAVIAVWVFARGRNPLAAIVPLVFLLAMTIWALFINMGNFFGDNQWLLLVLDVIILVLALWLVVEAIGAFARTRRQRSS